MFTVDKRGKVTISLGGVCSLGCKHCYVNSKDFEHQPGRDVDQVVQHVRGMQGVKCICVSGDIDPLLAPEENLSLLRQLAHDFTPVPVMFTTRLVPSEETYAEIRTLALRCLRRRQFLIPCVSLVTASYPNTIELPDKIPASSLRIEFVRRLASDNMPCFVALRPTFPFTIVGPNEIDCLIEALPRETAAVLGEVFLLDRSRQIPRRIGWDHFEDRVVVSEELTFIQQPAIWDKCFLSREVEYTRSVCNAHRLPYFLRSMSALEYLRLHWDENELAVRHPERLEELRDTTSIFP